ncbi:MAG: ADP-ribosylglycohydrolase family protein [Myxococcales bacterium]|jgi:ADP-ribosylglycohydrolase|nr:ADP-ribosylglycohydrolase family protein [Myxococcales bacterium]
MRDKNKFRGCLIGGAIGDALGYPVEFMSYDRIIRKYGPSGITRYELTDGVAQISDDTQMTLFTANGLLVGTTRGNLRGIFGGYPLYIWYCYKDWLRTQERTEIPPSDADASREYNHSWLIHIRELNCRRAPGNSCLSALYSGQAGTMDEPINQSKGCGGVMRVAPIGLYLGTYRFSPKGISLIGAEVAALTHGHDLGYIPAAGLVHIIDAICYRGYSGENDLKDIVGDCIDSMNQIFHDKPHIQEFTEIMKKAVALSESNESDIDCIRQIGGGWVAEETLAIAVFCVLRYKNDFEKAIIASVNHSGDSDSTGSVTGNILGAYHGYDTLPEHFTDRLELKSTILEIADDLYDNHPLSEYKEFNPEDQRWFDKYVRHKNLDESEI